MIQIRKRAIDVSAIAILMFLLFLISCDSDDNPSTDSVQDTPDDDDITDDDDDSGDDDDDDDPGDDDITDDDNDDADDDEDGIILEMIDGGAPGHLTVSMTRDSTGTLYIAADKATDLFLYRLTGPGIIEETHLRDFSWTPSITVDAGDHLHLAFNDWADETVVYGTNASGHWYYTDLDHVGTTASAPSIVVDPAGFVHIAYYDNLEAVLKYATNVDVDWGTHVVDPSFGVGYQPDMALDSQGFLHIAYNDLMNYTLRYATNRSGIWQCESIENIGLGSPNPEIRLDASDHVHIVFYNQGTDDVMYMTDRSGTWQSEVISHLWIDQFAFTSFQLDSRDCAHVAWPRRLTEEIYQLIYATNESGTWKTFLVDQMDKTGPDEEKPMGLWLSRTCDLLVDPADQVHIAYTDWGKWYLQYAHNDSGSWQIDVVDDASEKGWVSIMALDARGKSHILHNAPYLDSLWYATNETGSWGSEEIFSEPFHKVGHAGNHIAIDSRGRFHIVYYSDNKLVRQGKLTYAVNDGGGWQATVLEEERWKFLPGRQTALAVDSTDNLHLVYSTLDELTDTFDIRYGKQTGGNWEISFLLEGINLTHDMSLVLDEGDHPHICFLLDDVLYYGTNQSGTWRYEPVDALANVGYSNPIALDSRGFVHIAYEDLSASQLKYATNKSGNWLTTFIPQTHHAGRDASLTLDRQDFVHIAHHDLVSLDLQYATNWSGTWENHVILPFRDGGRFASLHLDDEDRIHISFHGAAALWKMSFPIDYDWFDK